MGKPLIVELYAPKDYGCQPYWFWDAPPHEQQGGCGPGEGIGDRLVPDYLLGLSIKPSCSIHDFMYRWGVTLDDKNMADRVFHQNMRRIVKKYGGIFKLPRYSLAYVYYKAVAYGGELAFWNSKHQSDLVEVAVT